MQQSEKQTNGVIYMAELSTEALAAKREYYRKYSREYRKRNRAHIREYHAEWRKNNPDKIAQYRANYWEKRAAKLKAAAESDRGEENGTY